MSHPRTAAAPPDSAEPATRPHVPPGVILAIACVANFMVIIDTSIVNVALPAMKAALGLSAADQQWVVDAYLITFGGFLLLAARAGDLFGRKGVFQAGLAVFTAASLAGGLARDPGLLIWARVVQGVGAAALASSSLSLITASHAEGPARTRALSLWAAAGSSAGAVGVVLGGLLTTELSWRYVLFINVPIGIALLIAAAASLASSPARHDWARLDLPGALTATVGFGSLVYAVSQATIKGWGSTPVVAALTAAVVLLATSATAGLEPRHSGLASGLFNMARQLGGAIGLAVLVTIAGTATRHSHIANPAAATVHGYRIALLSCAAVSLASVLIALLLPTPSQDSPGNPYRAPGAHRRRPEMTTKHYDEEQQLAAAVPLIAPVNASNRLCVITGPPGGGYQPGQFGLRELSCSPDSMVVTP